MIDREQTGNDRRTAIEAELRHALHELAAVLLGDNGTEWGLYAGVRVALALANAAGIRDGPVREVLQDLQAALTRDELMDNQALARRLREAGDSLGQ